MFLTTRHKLHSTAMLAPLTIPRRFRGPRTSANGGYAAGLLAQVVAAAAVEVTLRLPPPLERPLVLSRDGERVLLWDGEALVAEARPVELGLEAPASPTFTEAEEAARTVGGWGAPEFDECFVCGAREDGDGLDIHAGRVTGRDGLVAATWIAREVRPEIEMSVEQRHAWMPPVPGLDGITTEEELADPEFRAFAESLKSRQHPDHDTPDGWTPEV